MPETDLDPNGEWGDCQPVRVTPMKTAVRALGVLFLVAFAAVNIAFRGAIGGHEMVHVMLGGFLPLLAAGAVIRIMVLEYYAYRRQQGPEA